MKNIAEKIKLNNFDPDYISISIGCNYYLSGWMGDAEPNDFIQFYDIKFELVKMTDNDIETEDLIGTARCCYLSGYDTLHEKFVDLRDTADADSGDLLTAVIPVTDEQGMVLDDYLGSDVMYIEEFYIKPEYRGKGIGKLVFASIIDVIGRSAGVITIIPAPTEEDGKERIDNQDDRYEVQIKPMTDFIKKLGFDEVDKENNVWAKNTQYK